MLYFKDRQGGISEFSLQLSSSQVVSPFSSFFVVKEGGGEDVFDIVKDIEQANAENIPRRMIGKPSEWESVKKGEPLQTEIVPMSDGEFTGDYNTTWHVKVDVLRNGDLVNEGLTGFFAKQEALVTTSSITLTNGSGSIIVHKDNGEEESLTISTSDLISLSSSDPGATYRIYLQEGDMDVNSASGTITITNGKVVIAVEDGTASYDSINNIKYIKYEGDLTIEASSNQVQSVSEDEKSNLLVTVTDSREKPVKSFVVKDPYKQYYVRDGVYLSFSSGELKSGDSFEMKVGSGIEEKIGALDRAYHQILAKRTEVGARVESLNMAKNRYQQYVKDTQEEKAPLEDVDLAEATTELQKAQMALRGALLASLRLFTPTLLDFMR